VAQVTERLPSKPKALSSNPSITNKKKKKKEKKRKKISPVIFSKTTEG
jgi:hypothetical protein